MNSNECPKIEKCPIFIKGVLFSEMTKESYRNLYCLKKDVYPTCKRFQVSEILKSPVPENILPNSVHSVEEIIAKITNKK